MGDCHTLLGPKKMERGQGLQNPVLAKQRLTGTKANNVDKPGVCLLEESQ